MKLRIHGNSIRLRLNRREVAQFAAAGGLEEAFEYGGDPGNRLVYRIESSNSAPAIAVRVSNQAISIVLPAALAQAWTNTDRVGVSGDVPLQGDKRMTVLVEKEFRRLHGATFDPDLYPNPLEAKTA
ncbi:MAG: hypothetical protein LAP38_04890 [Acidobacteriia bacterium]|nr:hypothetical protein [Terriglobia bacterium]